MVMLYRTNFDPGVHSAAAWTLRQWQQKETSKGVDAELSGASSPDQQNWFINSQGLTFAVVNGPVEFQMGDTAKEKVTLTHRFAIATYEVTLEQFLQFRKNHRHNMKPPLPDCPVGLVSWYDAVAYCNWLSEQEKMPKDQWCYEPNDKGQYAEGMTVPAYFLHLSGYRLPTEVEWEYACRAGTTTDYSFGESIELLGRYAWGVNKLQSRMEPVGSLKPNELGLFDMHGNAWEWCHDLWEPKLNPFVRTEKRRVLRGGAFFDQPEKIRSASRYLTQPQPYHESIGFRPARTLP